MVMYSSYFMQASRLSRYVRPLWNYIFMGTEFGKGGPILAAKIGPGDHFWRRTDFFVTGQEVLLYTCIVALNLLKYWPKALHFSLSLVRVGLR